MRVQADELAEFFELLGQSTYYLQLVENGLHALLAIALDFTAPRSVTQAEADAAREKYRQKTLGSLIKLVEENEIISGPELTRLQSLNKHRRWIIHRLTIDSGYQITTSPDYRSRLFNFLNQLIDETQTAQRDVNEIVYRITVARGVRPSDIEEALERELRKIT